LSNNWVLGYAGSGSGYAIINFDSVSASIQQKSILNMSFHESFAGISDKKGKLLFYTNGVKINNQLNQTMLNGTGLNPGPYASSVTYGMRIGQGQIVIPFPDDTVKYYLFHETVDFHNTTYQPFNLFYSTIDMSLDSGRGGVVQKNIPAISDTLIFGELTACKHANGRDWWIIAHQYNSNLFYTVLVTPNGVSTPNSQAIGGFFKTGGAGQSSVAPNGKRYARYHPESGLDVYDFDRCSGTFSNWQHCDSITDYGGVAFSPNSNVLYVSATNNLYQFNLLDSVQSMQQRKFLIAQWDTFYSPNPPLATTYYMQQLAPDGKIYINSTNATNRLHIISQPDSIGLACNFIQHGLLLPCLNAFTIPNYPNYFLVSDSGSVCDTLQLAIKNSEISIRNEVVSLFPNPAKDNFTVSCKSDFKNSAIFILSNTIGDVLIRKTIAQGTTSFSVSTTELSIGIYYWKYLSELGKLVIIK
jgi:hypothetical protein